MKRNNVLRNTQGFTLVELAIVLVIIGLIVGGVLKGRSLIDNSKVKNVVEQTKAIEAAVNSYQDKYAALPGDDLRASTRWVGAGLGPALPADKLNKFPPQTSNGWVFNNLALAGTITGSYTGPLTYMQHKFGADVLVLTLTAAEQISAYGPTVTGNKAGNAVVIKNVTAEVSELIDRALDDGVPNAGSVVSTVVTARGLPTTLAAEADYTTNPMQDVYYFF